MTKAEFLKERLSPIVDALGTEGASNMGILSRAQAALFHNATQMLADLEAELQDEIEEEEG